MISRKNASNSRGKPFETGNPGKPKGARHKTTLLVEKLMQSDAKEIVKAVLDSAKGGDITAARIILDRIAPARRDIPISFELPKIERPADAVAAPLPLSPMAKSRQAEVLTRTWSTAS